MDNTNSKKLFISYSHDTEEHKQWVAKLAGHLRSHGVDVTLDQWDLRLGDDLPFFMEQGLDSAHMVLVICSSEYVTKANAGKGGTGYEKRILASDMLNGSNKEFILPVIRNNEEKNVPTYLKSILYIDFCDDVDYFDKYNQLLARIYDEDQQQKPALGSNPFDNRSLSSKIDTQLAIESIKYCNTAMEGSASFDYSSNNGIYIIGTGDYTFETMWSTAKQHCIYSYKDHVKRLGFKGSCTEFPSLVDVASFDFSSRVRTIYEGQVFILENRNNKFAAIKVNHVFVNTVDFGHIVEFEYKIYFGE